MWVLKLSLANKKMFIGKFTIKYKISATGYPLGCYEEHGKLYSILGGFMFGSLERKHKAIAGLRADKRVVNLEYKDDFVVITVEQPSYMQTLTHHPKVFRIEPALNNYKEKRTVWHLASFERAPLEEIIFLAQEYVDGEVLKFKEEKVQNIYFTQAIPKLTAHQREALDLAISHGYYECPRKITLPQLAMIKGIAYSTFQVHLRKAEAKVLPSIYRDL